MPWNLPAKGVIGSGAVAPAFQVARSLRFNKADTAYLERTNAVGGNRRIGTYSVWVKRSGDFSDLPVLLGGVSSADVNNRSVIYFRGSNVLSLALYTTPSATVLGQIDTVAVMRDGAAWMHICVGWNTTAGVNGVTFEINGVLQSTTVGVALAQNSDLWFAAVNSVMSSGRVSTSAPSNYYDGYLAEEYLIDGTKYSASDFGQIDPTTGQWVPKAFTGSFGVTGGYWKFADNSNTTAATLGKDSSGMSNLLLYSDDFTNAFWAKVQNAVLTGGQADPLGGTAAYKLSVSANTSQPYVRTVFNYPVGISTLTAYMKAGELQNGALYNGSSDGGFGVFDLVNGVVVNSGVIGIGTNPVCTISNAGGGWWKCSLTTTHPSAVADNPVVQAHTTSTINGQGIYIFRADITLGSTIPKELQFTNGTAVPDKNWTPNNFSVTAGVGNDSLVDTPTNYGTDTGVGGEVRGNYCTLNPNSNFGIGTYTNGNLDYTGSGAGWTGAKAGFGATFPFYFEATIAAAGAANFMMIGVSNTNLVTGGTFVGATADGWSLQPGTGANSAKWTNGASTAVGGFTGGVGGVMRCAADPVTGKVWFGYNGAWAEGNPSTGATPSFSGLPSVLFPSASANAASTTLNMNFGQRPFAFAAPTGFKALCTQNLPDPAIIKSSQYFTSKLFTGNASSQNIATEFQPDFVWMKNRTTAVDHVVYNSGRTLLIPLIVAGEEAGTNFVNYLPNGWSVSGSDARLNANASPYVGWAWKKSAALDIVYYAGDGTSPRLINHSLGVKPSMIVTKCLTGAASAHWAVGHKDIAADGIVVWSGSLGTIPASSQGAPTLSNSTSSVFGVKSGSSGINNTNAAGHNYMAFLFADVPAFCKVGSFTSNNSVDGPFVWCGFRPAWVQIKSLTNTANWNMRDSARDPYNAAMKQLQTDTAAVEVATDAIDLLSNGFKVRSALLGLNGSAETLIYLAFAESPFKYTRAEKSATSVVVSNPAATSFQVSAPATAVNGVAFNFSVQARAAGANTTNYTGTIHFTSTSGGATLPADATMVGGIGTFSATFPASGTFTITATDTVTGSINGVSGNIVSAAVTSGSQTITTVGANSFTVPAFNTLSIEVWGAGGGGGGAGGGSGAGSPGGASSYSTLVAGGGTGGGGTAGAASSGGVASGGDTNTNGSAGNGNPSNTGGAAANGGPGTGGNSAATGGGFGGGGGSYAKKTYTPATLTIGSNISIAVGGGGGGGSGTVAGTAGGNGKAIVTWS